MFEPIVYGNRIGLGVNMMRISSVIRKLEPLLNALKVEIRKEGDRTNYKGFNLNILNFCHCKLRWLVDRGHDRVNRAVEREL